MSDFLQDYLLRIPLSPQPKFEQGKQHLADKTRRTYYLKWQTFRKTAQTISPDTAVVLFLFST